MPGLRTLRCTGEEEAGVAGAATGGGGFAAVSAGGNVAAWLSCSQQDVSLAACVAEAVACSLLLIEDDVEQVDEAMFLGLLELEEAFS